MALELRLHFWLFENCWRTVSTKLNVESPGKKPIREHPKYLGIVHFINISFGLIIFKSWQINHANECANCIVLYKLFAALLFFSSFSLVLLFVCNVFGSGVKAINDEYIRNRHFCERALNEAETRWLFTVTQNVDS